MRAVACKHAELGVVERELPDPSPGQVRIEVHRCGICGSDLHARTGIDQWADVAEEMGYERLGRSEQEVVFGHEFSGVVAEHGPENRRKLAEGTPVVALPLLRTAKGIDATGLSVEASGGYAEGMLVTESLMMRVPNGLDLGVAALTEPMAVAWHAVRRGEVKRKDVAIVVGCGPVGLGVVLCLKAKGVDRVIASDLSPGRRELARACGADVVVDPRERSPYEVEADRHLTSAPEAFELAVSTRERLGRLPGEAWRHVWRLGELARAGPDFPIVFECVGAPGVIESIVSEAPLFSRVVVAGVCVGEDSFRPAMAINKELDLRFVIGYTPPEFRETLGMLADGKLDPRPMITGEVGLDGVAAAFDALADPERHAKILVDPRSGADEPVRV